MRKNKFRPLHNETLLLLYTLLYYSSRKDKRLCARILSHETYCRMSLFDFLKTHYSR